MKKNLVISILIVVLFNTKDVNAAESFSLQNKTQNLTDSLVLVNKSTGKEYTINKGQQIKLWFFDSEETISGDFQYVKNDTLQMKVSDYEATFSKKRIRAIKTIPNDFRIAVGMLFTVFGLLVCGISLFTLIAAMVNTTGWALLIVFLSIIFGVPGIGLTLWGKHLRGKKFLLNKVWNFKKT